VFLDKTRAELDKDVNLNLWSVINVTRAVLPEMMKRGKGCVVSIGSDAGRVGEQGEAVYAACKAGIIAFSKSLAKEHGRHNLRFNVICPGIIVPQMGEELSSSSMWVEMRKRFTPEVLERVKKSYPLRRLGTPADIAHSCVYLASDAASYITGQTLSVNGGYSML